MSGPMLALTFAGTALWCLPSTATSVERCRAALAPGLRGRLPEMSLEDDHVVGQWISPGRRRALVVAAGLFAVGLLLDLWPWWVGVGLSLAGGAAALRLPQRRSSAELNADRRELAVHADLLAACLETGMSIGVALLAVPAVPISPGGRRVEGADPFTMLDGVAALLMLGADPATAWAAASCHPDLADLAASARRSASGGAALAQAVREHGAGLRAAVVLDSARSAGRAGVAVTAPLGLCFLPAFLCLGLAPVVVGLLSGLHLF